MSIVFAVRTPLLEIEICQVGFSGMVKRAYEIVFKRCFIDLRAVYSTAHQSIRDQRR